MNWLGKMFKKKKKSYNTDCNYKLLIIDEKEELLHKIFGIAEERCEQLTKIAIDAYKNNDQYHSTLVEVIDHCKHTNEVVFATLITQKVVDRFQSRDKVLGMLNDIFGRG